VASEDPRRRFLRLSSRAVLLFLASRIGVLLVEGAVASAQNRPFIGQLSVWDSKWYLSIAATGYAPGIPPGHGNPAQSNIGFFPLLPILTKGTSLVTGLGTRNAALVILFVVGLLGSVALWWMLHDLFGVSGADRGTALVLFSPGAFVLSLVYSEPCFLLFVSLCLLALRRRRWVLAGLAAGIATAADPVGVAAVVPCIVAAWIAIRREGEWKALWAPLLAPLGIAAFFSYLWARYGTPFEWFHAQRAGWQSGIYFGSVPRAFGNLFTHFFADPNYGVKSLCVLVAIGLLVIFFRAKPPAPWIGYVLAVLFLGILSPLIGVTPRLLLRNFPLLAVVGARLEGLAFQVVFGFSALAMAALAAIACGVHWTP
jgi:hypothetical protein